MTLLSVRSEMRCAVLGALCHAFGEICLVVYDAVEALAHGGELFYNGLADLCFEVAVALALELALDLVERSSGAAE